MLVPTNFPGSRLLHSVSSPDKNDGGVFTHQSANYQLRQQFTMLVDVPTGLTEESVLVGEVAEVIAIVRDRSSRRRSDAACSTIQPVISKRQALKAGRRQDWR